MKGKDIDIYKLFSKTFKGRKMFGFMGFGELSRMDKVNKPIRQTEEIKNPIIEMLKKDNCKYSGKNRFEFVKEQMVESYKKHYPDVKEKETEVVQEDIIELPQDLINELNKGE